MTDGATSWRDVCERFGRAHEVPEVFLDALGAFVTPYPRGGPPAAPEAPWHGDFELLEEQHAPLLDVASLTHLLEQELDGKQPAMFARRLRATESILHRIDSPAARMLRVALRVRLDGMRGSPPPRARRVRALADFYYSYAARLRHPEWTSSEQHLENMVTALRWVTVGNGVEHAVLDGLADGMPVHVNLLRVDPARVHIDVVDLFDRTSMGVSFADAAGEALAGVSGGFFLYSEDDIDAPSARHDPVGLLLTDGQVVGPPVFRRASVLVGAGGEVAVRRVSLAELDVDIGGNPAVVRRTRNRADDDVGPDEDSIAVVGRTVTAVGRRLPVPLNGFIATLDAPDAQGIEVGAAVRYSAPTVVEGVAAVTGVAGGPLLVQDGKPVLDMHAEDFWGSAPPITFSQDETGDHNLLARLAVGVDADGRLLAAAVDGRNVERALGMTLGDVSRLMILLGCRQAANMDGGSSKRMLVDGRTVDIASTEIVVGESRVVPTRPVHTALLFRAR